MWRLRGVRRVYVILSGPGKKFQLCYLAKFIKKNFSTISVMRLIKDWLNNEHVILADDALDELREFILTVNDSEYLNELILEVVKNIRKKVSIRSLS
jgi:hypothetical protein